MIDEKGLIQLGINAKKVSRQLRTLETAKKNNALIAMAQALRENTERIMLVSQKEAEKARQNGRTEAFIDRLVLNAERIESMASGLEKVSRLPDPVSITDKMWVNYAGIQIGKRRVPLGVIGIIYESRPNVTSDAAGLCFKSGNAVILRGGRETLETNGLIVSVLHSGLEQVGIPKEAIQFIDNPDHELATQFMQMRDYIDVLIPRGGERLIRSVVDHARIPTIETGVGNCHLYVHEKADLKKALAILVNGKTQRVSVCNALETLIVDERIAAHFLPLVEEALLPFRVRLHGDLLACEILPSIIPATEEDWQTEYLDDDLAVKVVSGYQEAIDHIETYSSKHSDAIVTEDYSIATQFLNTIDSAVVYVNASTRFTDGEEFGFGGEIGISTQKLHARGPMGLEALTSYKYVMYGDGQIRE